MIAQERPIVTEREIAHQKYKTVVRFAVLEPAKLGPTELPELPDGGTRKFFDRRSDLLDFVRSGDYERALDGNSIVTRIDKASGRFAIDIVPLEVEAESGSNSTRGSRA